MMNIRLLNFKNTWKIYSGLLSLSLLFTLGVNAQNQRTEMERSICILKVDPSQAPARVAAPANIRNGIANNDTPCGTIEVRYIGFDDNQPARDAFQYAVDIWTHSIGTTVDINMIATFEDLGGSQGGGITLGSAGPVNFQTDDEVDGIDENFWYGKPLFENLRGFDDSITGDSNDINARFNSNPDVNWYYGTDANPPANQIDFVSVVLHEIGHGIAFVGSASVDGNNIDGFTGSAFLGQRPIIYNDFIETGDGTALLTIEEDSEAMADALTSNDLFCNSPATVAANGGTPAKIFAPETFNPGSSFSHWNEATYPPGDPNALMTPTIGNGQAVHNVGDITLGFFEDMGWVLCQALSTAEFTAEEISVSPVPFQNNLEIRLPNSVNFDNLQIAVFDITGKVVYEHVEAPFDGRIELNNISDLSSNIYFLKITNPTTNQTITKKIIKG